MRTEPRFFYGWVVVAMCFLLTGLGATHMLVGVLVVPLAEAFAAQRGQVLMMTSSLMMLTGAVVSPFSGMLILRYTARRVALCGLAWTGLGYLALCLATQLWQVAAIYMLAMSVGMSVTSLAASTLAANWFTARRGRALGFTAAGVSSCAFILQPLMTYWIQRFGLRIACLCLGLTLLCVVAVLARFLVERPQLRGLHPDGAASNESRVDQRAAGVEWNVRKLLRQSRFWILATLVSLNFGVHTALFINLVPLAIDRGFSSTQAAWFASLTAICNIVGTVGFGLAADFLGQRVIARIPVLLAASSCVLLTLPPTAALLFASTILIGLALGASASTWGTLVGLTFGSRGLGLAMGLIAPFIAATVGVTTPLAGWINDVYGSYQPAFIVFLGMLAVSAILGGFLPSQSRPQVAAAQMKERV